MPGHNNVTRVRVEPRSREKQRRKNDELTLSATLPTTDYYRKCGKILICFVVGKYFRCYIALTSLLWVIESSYTRI